MQFGNTGFGTKSLWDWLDLLIIPVVLAVGAWWLNKQQKETEQAIARDGREQQILNKYFDRMTELLLGYDLRREEDNTKKGKEARTIARARTLDTLGAVNGKRKGQVIRFLAGANLIRPVRKVIPGTMKVKRVKPVVSLRQADLRRLVLTDSLHTLLDLREADMRDSDLSDTILNQSDLYGCNLRGAKLTGMQLMGTSLEHADLRGADLRGSDLRAAIFKVAKYTQDGKGATLWPEGFDPKAAGAILVDEDGNPVADDANEAS